MVVDGDVDVLPARAGRVIGGVSGDAMTRPRDASQLLDIEMPQVARRSVFVARIDRRRLQISDAVEFQSAQCAADGGTAQARLLRDAMARRALATKRFDVLRCARPERVQWADAAAADASCGRAGLPARKRDNGSLTWRRSWRSR